MCFLQIRAALTTAIEKIQPTHRNIFISYKYTGSSLDNYADDVKQWSHTGKEALKSFLLDEALFFT